VPATALTVIALSPVGAMGTGMLLQSAFSQPEPDARREPTACEAPCDRFGALAKLPPAYILAGLDLTPRLLVMTPHRYGGSSHHRAPAAIRRVIDAFIGPPEVAHHIMAGRGMTYLLIDPDGNEASLYSKAAPQGLMAELLRGRAPVWLKPVPLAGSTLRLWRRVG